MPAAPVFPRPAPSAHLPLAVSPPSMVHATFSSAFSTFASAKLPSNQWARWATPSQDSRTSDQLDLRPVKKAKRSDKLQAVPQAGSTDTVELADLASFSSLASSTGSLEQGRRDFHARYTVKEEIGKGGFGTVFSAVRRRDGLEVAVKEVAKKKKVIVGPAGLPLEVALLQQVQELPGVIGFIDYFNVPESFYIVMERVDGKDLFDFISEKGRLPEAMAKEIFLQLLNTVIGCHRKGVVHRDIKDENILLDPNTHEIKLIDFGSAAVLVKNKLYCDYEGTKAYYPPEWFLCGSYRAEGLTAWSLGILLFGMLSGELPWDDATEVTGGELPWPEGLVLSREVKRLVASCLVVEARDRVELEEMKEHPWLVGDDIQGELELSFDWDFPPDPDHEADDDSDSDSDSSI